MEVNYKDGSDQITTFSQDSQASNKSNEKCSSPSYHKEEMLIKTESSEYEESQQDAPQSNEVLNDEEKHYDSLGLLDIKKELDYNGDPLENTSKLFCEKIIELIKPEPDDLELLETNRDTYFINSNKISVLGKRKRSGSTENYHSETEQDQEVMSVDKDISHTTENIMEVETLHSNDDDNVASCSFQADDSAQNTSNECLYECNVCSKKFLTGLALKLHQHKQHNGSSDKFVEISNSEVFCDFKRKMTSKRYLKPEEIACLLENSDVDQDECQDSSDTETEHNLEERIEDSASEQDDVSDKTDEDVSLSVSNCFIGTDKITKWFPNPFSIGSRTRPHNQIRHLPEPIGDARQAKSVAECWTCLFTDDILDIVVIYTNQYIQSVKDKYDRDRDVKCTDVIEMKAFIGLLYLAGAYKGNRQSLEEFWGTDGDGVERFSLVMSIRRFKFLLRCLRFDDLDTRTTRKAEDRLAPIRDIFARFVNNCQKNYRLGEYVTIDEMMAGFRGRCGFRQYIPSKPNKYGIKMYALVDAKTYYLYHLEIYAGKQPDGPYSISNKPVDVVRRLTASISGSGRNITAGNCFTNMDLVQELLKKKLSYVGTLKRNKRQLPPEFVISKGRKRFSSLFGFQKDTMLVSYVPKPNKTVLVVSTLHVNKEIDPNSGDKQEPSVLTFYNETKGGVDTADQMCASYNVARNSKRWPMVVFFTMLNIAGINSQAIYLGNCLGKERRRIYLKMLSKELVAGELARRSVRIVGMPMHLQARLQQYRPYKGVGENEDDENTPGPSAKRSRCSPCTRDSGRRRLSRFQCKNCSTTLCLEHAILVCKACFESEPTDLKKSLFCSIT